VLTCLCPSLLPCPVSDTSVQEVGSRLVWLFAPWKPIHYQVTGSAMDGRGSMFCKTLETSVVSEQPEAKELLPQRGMCFEREAPCNDDT
jgi:hypothetical protein